MKDESSAPLDLASLEQDLAQCFLPSWTKDANHSERLSRMAENSPGDDRRRSPRSGAGAGRGSDGGRDRNNDRSRKPSGSSSGSRPSSGSGAAGGAGRSSRDRPSQGQGRDQRPSRFSENRQAQAAPPPRPVLVDWNLQILPDSRGMDAMAKQIKSGTKAYPLFDLARLILEKPERYRVELKKSSETATPLYQAKIDGSVWLNENDAIKHVFTAHFDTYYRKEVVSIDPPKGAYPFVAQCGMSGVLLGPPNFHEYQAKLLKLHAERYANMPFDVYKSRIRMLRDEASIQKWKDEVSTKNEFYAIDLSLAAQPDAAPAAALAEPAVPTSETAEVIVEPAASAEVELTETPVSEETLVSPEAATEVSEPGSDALTEEIEVAQEIAPVAATTEPASTLTKLANMTEVERHFRETHAAKVITAIRERVILPGATTQRASAQPILQLTRHMVEDLRRFPLPLVHNLSRRLSSKGLQLFKAQQNITYISIARPRYLDRVATPVSDRLSEMLDYLEAHPKADREIQWKALLALRPVGEGITDTEREHAMLVDLAWLLHEGHVIDYVRGNLQAAHRPQPKPAPRPKAAAKTEVEVKIEPKPEPGVVAVAESEQKSGPVLEVAPTPDPTPAEDKKSPELTTSV